MFFINHNEWVVVGGIGHCRVEILLILQRFKSEQFTNFILVTRVFFFYFHPHPWVVLAPWYGRWNRQTSMAQSVKNTSVVSSMIKIPLDQQFGPTDDEKSTTLVYSNQRLNHLFNISRNPMKSDTINNTLTLCWL